MSQKDTPRYPSDRSPWNPAPNAVRRWRSAEGESDQPATLLLHHPLAPFVAQLPNAEEDTLQQAALAYLRQALQLDALARAHDDDLKDWVDALTPGGAESAVFGWMPLALPGSDAVREPLGSFRSGPADGPHLVALFASQRIGKNDFLGSGFGLRVVLGLRPLRGGFEATITSLAASLPFGLYRTSPVRSATLQARDYFPVFELSDGLCQDISRATGLEPSSISLRALRLAEKAGAGLQVERQIIGYPAGTPQARSRVAFSFTLVGDMGSAGALVHRSELVADMAVGDAKVFERDAASQHADAPRARGVRRDAKTLDALRTDQGIHGALKGPLETSPVLTVWPSRFALGDRSLPMNAARPVELPGTGGPEVRSDDASAVQVFRHVRELFERLDAYQLPTSEYFRTAQAKIDVFYRSGISPGPSKDGSTVNARVLPEGWSANFFGTSTAENRPSLQLHLGWADLLRRERAPWKASSGVSAAIPLGIAADARWMWHEFGHLLLMATTGELELRFAHSPGDALAAIVADPLSTVGEQRPRWRFATYPWVMLPRRHDRCVLRGWSWSGTIHAALARVPQTDHPRRKGYLSEQILSSTLFRLYRCLGGDTHLATDPGKPDTEERQRASHYSVWLILKALHLMGDARVAPAGVPEALAVAMMEADTTLKTLWDVEYPKASGQHHRRIGGSAHKAIRWAFEAQGLYVKPGSDGNAPGAPPAVDVYIASGRAETDPTPYGDVFYGPGNYMPVSLHWQADAGPAPEWQAHADALVVQADGSIHVNVGNRGDQTAQAATVDVWWASWPAGTEPPQWPDTARWTACVPTAGLLPQDILPGDRARFGPFQHARPAERYVVLARSRCEADRANIDPTTLLACSFLPTPLVDLVANDNNLGLRVVD